MSDPVVTTIEVPPSYVQAAISTIDEESRTVELVFSTGAAFGRCDWATGRRYQLRFSLQAAHVRLGRLNNGAPLLNAHSTYDLSRQVGVVVDKSAAVDGKEARCTVRFSRRDEVEPIWQDVKDGIIRNVSVGATIHKFVEDKAGGQGGLPLRTAVDWEPFEVSLVPVGADDGAKVKASNQPETNPCVLVTHVEDDEMSEEKAAEAQGVVERLRAHLNTFFDKFQSDAAEASVDGSAPAPSAASERTKAASAKDVLRMCREGGFPTLAEGLLEQEATTEQVEAALARAKAINELCEAAEMEELAAGYIAGAMSPDAVRQQLAIYAAKADGGEISGHVDPDARASQAPRIDTNAIYAARNKAFNATTQQES